MSERMPEREVLTAERLSLAMRLIAHRPDPVFAHNPRCRALETRDERDCSCVPVRVG